MNELYSDYETKSYNIQLDICRLRRSANLSCRNCKFHDKCKSDFKRLQKLNDDLKSEFKERYVLE